MSQGLSTEKSQRPSTTMCLLTDALFMSTSVTQMTMTPLITRTPTNTTLTCVELDSDFHLTSLRTFTTETLAVIVPLPVLQHTGHPYRLTDPLTPNSTLIAITTVKEEQEDMFMLLMSPAITSALNLPITTITRTATHPDPTTLVLTSTPMPSLSLNKVMVMVTPQIATAET